MGTEVHSMISDMDLLELHRRLYQTGAALFAAPGRVNLIGEHTDYCDGFVMPAAIEFSTRIAVSARTDGRFVAHSEEFNEQVSYGMEEAMQGRRGHWSDYPVGTLWALQSAGIALPGGISLTITGNVPLGAGLSSSASIEVATALAALHLAQADLPREQVAQLCQKAENGFVGANSGIMDQFVIACAAAGDALMLDCRSLHYDLVPIPAGVQLVICNSMVKHSVAGGAYNTRRAEIEEGTAILRSHRPEIKALRDATVDDLARWGAEMPENVLRRCRHVITEDNRVLEAVDAFRSHDLRRFGELMYAAHASFRDDFEASCPEVDLLVELASEQPGCYGARMTGGGFGGCTINLVTDAATPGFIAAVHAGYQEKLGIDAAIYTSKAADRAHAVAAA